VSRWGRRPTSLVGCLWLFVGGCTHLVSQWAMVVRACAPRCSWILTGGSRGGSWAVVPVSCCGGQLSFEGGWCGF
jgi:hypothetical protein